MTNNRQESFTDADASGNNDYQKPQQDTLKESFNMDEDKKTTDGCDHLTKNPIIVTEQDLLEDNFVYRWYSVWSLIYDHCWCLDGNRHHSLCLQ